MEYALEISYAKLHLISASRRQDINTHDIGYVE